MPQPLTPGTLLPGETTYPSELQVLVNRLATVLFTQEPPKDFYRHNSPDQAPAESLWLDYRSGALKAQNISSAWRGVLGGNFSVGQSSNNGALSINSNLFNPSTAVTSSQGHQIATFKVKPYTAGNFVFVGAWIPAVTASESDVTVYGTLACGTQVIGVSTTTVRLNELNSLFVAGVHTVGNGDISAGEVTYTLRLGTDDNDAQVYYNRKVVAGDVFNNFLKTVFFAVEVPAV